MAKMNENNTKDMHRTRRQFIKDASLTVAGTAIVGSCAGTSKQKASGLLQDKKMKYRRLGRTGLQVSEIGLGGHYDGPKHQQKKSKEQWQRNDVFKECLQNGINLYDTNTEYERDSLGVAFKTVPEIRDQILIVAEINDRKETGPETFDFMMNLIDEQLQRLQVPCADIFRFTTVIKKTSPQVMQAAIKAFKDMKKAGKVKYFAVSQHDPDLLLQWVNEYDEIDIIYAPYNYFAPKAAEELFPTAKKKDIGVIVIKPFNKGTIFDPKLIENMVLGEGTRSIIEKFEEELKQRTPDELTKESDLTLAQASLRYILANENVSTVIPGMETVEEVRENMQVLDEEKFGKAERELLDRYAANFHTVLPENYQWLKCWRCA